MLALPSKACLVLAASLMLSGRAHAEQALNAVTGVRFWSLGEATRVVIETSGEFEFLSDRARGPERLFFDLKRTTIRLGRRPPHTFTVGDALLKQIRIAETARGITRIVFDLNAEVDHTASQLTNPDRLIVELRPAGTPQIPRSTELPQPPTISSSPAPAPAPSATKPAELPSKAADPVKQATAAATTTVPDTKMSTPPALPNSARPSTKVASLPTPAPLKAKASPPPRPAKFPEGGSQSLTRVLGLKIGRIVLDAGHGGQDSGTAGPGGLYEKDLVLDVVKRLGALIEDRMGAEVIYTRQDDTFVPLETRTQIANEKRADLFLSIHANSSSADNASGVETYFLNFTTSKAALDVAARENASSQKTVYELKDLLQKIALQDKVDESREFAAKIQESLYRASAKANGRTKDRGVKKAPFVVLIGASMPSVLAEIGFVSNPKDEALFKKPEFRQKIAEGLYRGLAQYASTLSQFQVAKN